ncbi:MAG: outer membrane lipoprotein LolB [Gammaproteobacteria bacterium]|jgi:outer membrane lipoprotein LolB
MTKPTSKAPKLLRLGVALMALFLVSACGSNPPHKVEGGKPSPTWKAQQRYLSKLSAWEMSGRAGSGLGFSGQLNWVQQATQSYINISGPLGIGALEIIGNADQVSLRDKHGIRTVVNPEAVLRESYGLPLPIDYLRWWMLGIAAPNERAGYQFDNNGNAAEIHQAGWRVTLTSYQLYDCSVVLPRKMTLVSGDHKLKVVVKKWTPLEGRCGVVSSAALSSALLF